METHDFGWAVRKLKAGIAVTRAAWAESGEWIELQVPDSHSKMTLPYLYIERSDGQRAPWFPSHVEALAEDWEIAVKRMVS